LILRATGVQCASSEMDGITALAGKGRN